MKSCVPNTHCLVAYAMSEDDGSEAVDSDLTCLQSQWPFMISILTESFRCVLCAPSSVNIWSPPPLRCVSCTGDLLVCAAAVEETDNEENVAGEHIVIPRNRRDFKADAMWLWRLLTQKPSNECCPVCQMAKAQNNVRHMRGPAEG